MMVWDGTGGFLNRLCGDAIPLDETSTGNVMRLQFSSNMENAFKGFTASWTSSCEEILRDSAGTISSPSIQGTSKHCTYIIEQRDTWWRSFVIRLEFQQFQLGGDPNDCGENYVEVRDGGISESPLLGRFCGNDIPSALTSTSSMMRIDYVTDGSSANGGFTATYSEEQPTCGSVTLTSSDGSFVTPSHPNNYPNAAECTWQIVAQDNHKIKLTFDTFLLEGPSPACYYDWVKIYDGNDLLGQYCGVSAPDTITSTSNTLTVTFYTDWSVTFEGFSASYVTYDPASDALTRQYDLYPFGEDNGDKQLVEKEGKSKKVTIQTGFPVGQELQKEIFIGSKGLVSFGRRDKGKQFKLKGHKQMLCPYNSNINGSEYGDGGVFYQLYADNAQVLNKATSEVREFTDLKDYKASLVLVVTWYRVQHLSSSNPDLVVVVGQLALVPLEGRECCYSADWWNWDIFGQYLSDAPHAGSATAFNPSFWSLRSDYQREDRQAHDVCCYNTTNSDYCRMYYELRPIGECTTRIPFRFCRTGLAETESGTVTNATVFKAFGATENGISVTVDLDPNSNETMIIYGNGTDYTTDFYQYGNEFEVENDAYLLTNTNSSFKVTFTSGAVTESNTVLRYPPREGPADYAHPEFTPIFLDEQPADVKQAAEDLCGATNLACVYDYVATGSAAIASSTKDTADNADRRETVSSEL
nr:hypothetical protein BaRGS_001734 [Batillaria attramentaria]